jgi:hypothetical protein
MASPHPLMKQLKLIYLTIIQLARQVCSLPRTIADAVGQKRRKAVLDVNETERLDRIRNPSKYLGK